MSSTSGLPSITPSWKDEYLTGIAVIDEQHRHFFAFVVELQTKSRTGLICDDRKDALLELINYACYHFTTEEEWMRTHAYPAAELGAHCQEHARFVDDIKKLRTRMYEGEDIFADLLTFASEWLIGHITQTDAKYARFARQQR